MLVACRHAAGVSLQKRDPRARSLKPPACRSRCVRPISTSGALKRKRRCKRRSLSRLCWRVKKPALSRGLRPGRLVLGADQILSLDGARFSKPADRAAARDQLRSLSGRSHELYSAVAFVQDGAVLFEHVGVARLTMRAFSDRFLDDYLDAVGDAATASVGAYQLEGSGRSAFRADRWRLFHGVGITVDDGAGFSAPAGMSGAMSVRAAIRALPDRLARHGQVGDGENVRGCRCTGA